MIFVFEYFRARNSKFEIRIQLDLNKNLNPNLNAKPNQSLNRNLNRNLNLKIVVSSDIKTKKTILFCS